MVATPQDPSLLARIQRLEQTVKNLSSKGFGITNGALTLPKGTAFKSADGTVMFQSDPLGGLAYPWYSVPLLQAFTGPTGPSATASWPNGNTQGFQQMASNATGPGPALGGYWFAGFLPYVSHPRLQLQTMSACQAGGTVNWQAIISPNFNSPTVVGSWTDSNSSGAFSTRVFDLTPWLGLTNVGFALSPVSITGSNGIILMQPYGCFLRGSV